MHRRFDLSNSVECRGIRGHHSQTAGRRHPLKVGESLRRKGQEQLSLDEAAEMRDTAPANALSCSSTPISMFRSSAASVRFAEVTNATSSSTTSALAWRTPSGPSGTSERGS